MDKVAQPGTMWWTACETYTWLAFGEARPMSGNIEFPQSEWARDWIGFPQRELGAAFAVIGFGRAWPYDDEDEPGEAYCLEWARRIMDATGESAERLSELLEADIAKSEAKRERLRQAFRTVTAALRDGHLVVEARPAHGLGGPNESAVHETVDTRLFWGPRAVSVFGWIDYLPPEQNGFDPRTENDFRFLNYKGPFYDEVRFNAAQVRQLCQAVASPSVSRTGMAGRPSSKHLIIAELERRVAIGVRWPTLAACATNLLQWLRSQHPEAPVSGQGAVENAIREDFNRLRAKA